jgi:hypothetical protein
MADPIVGSQHEADNVLQVNQAEFEEAARFRLDANYEPAWTEEEVNLVKEFVSENFVASLCVSFCGLLRIGSRVLAKL